MLDFWIFLCIFFPLIAGALAYLDKGNHFKKQLVVLTGAVLCFSSFMLLFATPGVVPASSGLVSFMRTPLLLLDFALLALFIYIGIQKKHKLIIGLAAAQVVGMFVLESFSGDPPAANTPMFTLDSLALTMVLVISFVGSAIAYYSIDYMQEHEKQHPVHVTRQPRFFALILIFLGVMNGLSLADDLSWIYFFWEVTTLCSFLLIGHDETEQAKTNATLALWMNLAGGTAFMFALCYLQNITGTLSLTTLSAWREIDGISPITVMLPVVALCFAAFTKSAQIPFQSWLCGAMVAPTPVSALLHSSTMVKAGVYLTLRLAPIYAGTSVSVVIALCGSFTFIAAAAFAVGQSNGKKILAYSTISNLGLIIACAGINTQASLAAGVMLLIFHAISKALLFLCVGSIEQRIGSRDIEDMRGLFTTMPRTALLTAFGIVTMMLPPFGMLLAKWMALESALEARAAMPLIVAMLALGSGLTVLFWARWAGIILGSASPKAVIGQEHIPQTIGKPLRLLAGTAAFLSFFAPILYILLIEPIVANMTGSNNALYTAGISGIGNKLGLFAVYPLYLLIGIGAWYAWQETKRYANKTATLPYMAGIQATENNITGFIGPMKSFVAAKASNYYLDAIFGEDKITRRVNTIGIALLFILLGGILQ